MKTWQKLFLWGLAIILVLMSVVFFKKVLFIILLSTVLYLVLSIQFLKPNEKGEIYILDKKWMPAKSGPNIVPFLLSYVVRFPTGIQTLNLVPETIMINEDGKGNNESQTITVDNRQPFLISNVALVYEKTGAKNIEELFAVMFGAVVEYTDAQDGKTKVGWEGGLAGDEIADKARDYVASDKVKTLDDAYRMTSSNLGKVIQQSLEEEFPKDEYGIDWKATVINDVYASREVEEARNKKAQAAIEEKQSKIDAQKNVNLAEGEAKANLAKGTAQAEVDYRLLAAKLKLIKDAGRLKAFQNSNQLLPLTLFGSEFAEKLNLGETKFFMAPDLQKILGSLLGKTTNQNDPNSILSAFLQLSELDQQKVIDLISSIGGK